MSYRATTKTGEPILVGRLIAEMLHVFGIWVGQAGNNLGERFVKKY